MHAALLEVAGQRRNSARWAVALALGLRQGEVLGLKWEDVDLDRGTLRVRRSRLRAKYKHGCGDTCGRTPGRCPERIRANPQTKPTKSKAGRRTIGLPPPLVALLRKHRADQEAEREAARQLCQDEGWVFAKPDGTQMDDSTDRYGWKALLEKAGLRDARLHDARHSAATMLLVLGQPERTVMSLMGWSSSDMIKRYQHVTDGIRAAVASQVGGLIWEAGSEETAEQTVTVRRDSLAAILPFVKRGLDIADGDEDPDFARLQAAFADLHAAMSRPVGEDTGEVK